MSEMIESKNELFPGKMIEKPLLAKAIFDGKGEPLYICPHCHKTSDIESCDVIGAEPGCVFCNQCNREFELPEIWLGAEGGDAGG